MYVLGVATEPEEVDELVGLGCAARARPERARAGTAPSRAGRCGARLERDLDRLAHGELGEERRRLERAAEPVPGPLGASTCSATSSPCSSIRPAARDEPTDRVHQRRLAGAVGADEPDDLAGADLERHVVDGADATEADA